MTHKYQVSGMTCGGCAASVKTSLQAVAGVTSVEVSKAEDSATISMDKHIDLPELQKALGGVGGKYQISVA